MEHQGREVVIIGAGPSGLSAALDLCRGGIKPLVLERTDAVGGLMRSFRWGDFIFDLGRKELYSRIPEVDALWSELLGDDFRPYPHRVGSLYRGRIVELSNRYRGPLRGIPPTWLVAGGLSLCRGWSSAIMRSPGNYEEYWHGRAGAVFARILAQGYWEKFRGLAWADMPAPEVEGDGARTVSHAFDVIRHAMTLERKGGVSTQPNWRHPARGTGQLFERVLSEARLLGGDVVFETDVRALSVRSDGTFEISALRSGVEHRLAARYVVSSLQIEQLTELLNRGAFGAVLETPKDPWPGPEAQQNVLLVYLFFDAPPRFPHAWLEVNDPQLRCGRITNYAGFGGEMTPPGKTSLCIEFFCASTDPLMQQSDQELTELAVKECVGADLIDPARSLGSLVLRKPRTNASASWREQQSEAQRKLLEGLRPYRNLFHVNRAGSDVASYAGLVASRAIISGQRQLFDQRADPTRRWSKSSAAV